MTGNQIQQTNPNVIALQEVRAGGNDYNQITDLKKLLPSQYKWHVFRVANNVTSLSGSISNHWTREGVGLISNLPIVKTSFQAVTPGEQDPDTNKRVILHASVEVKDGTTVNIVVVHLSYHKPQQCRNAAEILRFIAEKQLKNVIVVGDFNAYNAFEWPIIMLSKHQPVANSPCRSALTRLTRNGMDLSSVETLQDVWTAAHGNTLGYTFSNMPTPGLESRPDRILVSTNFEVNQVMLDGFGTRYKRRYQASIHWERFLTILQSARLSYQGQTGYPCVQDCGPRGSCQCGVCRKGGNKHDCLLPNCKACDQAVFTSVTYAAVFASVIFLHVCFSVLLILIVGAGSYGNTMFSILGCNCCLCNPRLFSSFRFQHRKCRLLRVCQLWPLFRLPPYFQLAVACSALFILVLYSSQVLEPVLELTYAAMDEEYFPSDHLMLTAYIE